VIRKHLVAAVTLALAVSGLAAASPTAIRSVTTVPRAAQCGGTGFVAVLTPGVGRGFSCFHTTLDAFDSRASAYARAMGIKPATAPVKCYGDGTTGPRIQFIYGYYDGLPNRAKTVIPQVRTQMAPRMQAVINAQSLGKDLGLRFAWTKGCGAIDVMVVHFPRSIQYDDDHPGDPYRQMGRMEKYLSSHGFTREDRKYQVLFDGWDVGACGIGETIEFQQAGQQISSVPSFPLADGFPTIGGHTDPGTLLHAGGIVPYTSTKYSMVWNHAGGPKGPSCFNTQGISTVTPQLHELFHTLGAVQFDAPHANATGHCDDAPSVMCPGQGPGYGGGVNNPSCAKVTVETLDCGMDDYWNPSPKVGEYLFSHLNIAKSQFFGPQPQDNLATAPN
jgi:hypothetical protein